MNDDPHASDELPIALSLEQVQKRFESWRQRRKKRGKIGTRMFLCVSFHRVRLQIHLFPHQIMNLVIQLSCFL